MPGLDDEHVAAGAETGQQRLARERRQHRGKCAVDGIPTLRQRVGPGPRGQRMAGRDHAERLGHHDSPICAG